MPAFLSNAKINQVSNAGPVVPMSFVTNDPNQAFTCRQATGNDLPAGIVQVGADITPGLEQALFPSAPTPTIYAGQPGSQVQICTVGDVAPVRLGIQATGNGGVKNGTILTNDGSGLAIPVGATGANSTYRAGVALKEGQPGEIVEMFFEPGLIT
jgi:hypothetical protein